MCEVVEDTADAATAKQQLNNNRTVSFYNHGIGRENFNFSCVVSTCSRWYGSFQGGLSRSITKGKSKRSLLFRFLFFRSTRSDDSMTSAIQDGRACSLTSSAFSCRIRMFPICGIGAMNYQITFFPFLFYLE